MRIALETLNAFCAWQEVLEAAGPSRVRSSDEAIKARATLERFSRPKVGTENVGHLLSHLLRPAITAHTKPRENNRKKFHEFRDLFFVLLHGQGINFFKCTKKHSKERLKNNFDLFANVLVAKFILLGNFSSSRHSRRL